MESEGYGRAVVLAFATFFAMVLIGVLSVFAAKSLEPDQTPIATIATNGLQIVDADCAGKLVGIQAEMDSLSMQVESWKVQIAAIQKTEQSHLGSPVTTPENIPEIQTAKGFSKAMASQEAFEKRKVKLALVTCEAYPCVAVFYSQRKDVLTTLRSPLRDLGFSWSSRWVAKGESSHADGTTYFAAIRFFPHADVQTVQARYLSLGLDQALDQAMSQTIID
jgi:hypothetical protein